MPKIRSMVFLIFMVILNIGCGEDYTETITLMYAEATGIQICSPDTVSPLVKNADLINEIKQSSLHSVFAIIEGSFGGCDSYHETRLSFDREFGLPTWQNGDTIEIEVMKVHVEGSDCPEAINPYQEVVFIGFFFPGQYTLKVNNIESQFTVGNL